MVSAVPAPPASAASYTPAVRLVALLLAIAAAGSWGIGGILLKKGTDVATPATILAVQYATGLLLVVGWLVASGGIGAMADVVERRWGTLLVLALFQIGGYVFFVSAVRHAGEGSIPTSVAIAISAAYPAVVVVLSGPFLGEALHWNHVAGALLVVGGVILALAL
jgi:drug/metabolite transporter (DMT)-like permease